MLRALKIFSLSVLTSLGVIAANEVVSNSTDIVTSSSFNLDEANKHLWLSAAGRCISIVFITLRYCFL